MNRSLFLILPALLLVLVGGAFAQQTGTIDGSVSDSQGLVLPGVTVTMSGEAVLGQQTVVTLNDGSYRFRALRAGNYNLSFELPGFQTLNREGIVVGGGRTVTVNITLDVATVAETITVTGESPIVDVRNTALSNEFNTEALQDVPSATDVWAVLGQTPGVRMRGYDVGGSHKSQQTGYESFGIRRQNRVLSDGVDTTESTSGTGFYFDYYSIEEFTTAAAGADVMMTAPGSMVVMTMKSGGNELSGLFHIDYESEGMVGNNVDDELAARDYTGNPNLKFYEFHADMGGAIVQDKAWFYGFYNNFKIDKQISGVSPDLSTDIGDFDMFGGKVTFQVSDKDQIIGYSQWSLKEKPNRGLSNTVPPESILAQASWSWAHKAEWQRVWSDRVFTNVQLKHFGFGWPMVPAIDFSQPGNEPRTDQTTSIRSGAGWNTTNPPFTLNRWKPQVSATVNYYMPDAAGSHDWKFGLEWAIDSAQYGSNGNSGSIRYFDNSALGRPNNVDEIALFNIPADPAGFNAADDRDKTTAIFVQDTWSPNSRLTLNLGFRFARQNVYYLDADLAPLQTEFFPTGTIPGETTQTWNNFAPRLGLTYDVSGSGKTVAKAHYGRYYFNIADTLSAGNPAAAANVRYKFLDQNANGIYDGSSELGALVSQSGTTGSDLANVSATEITDLDHAYADEISLSVEHELAAETSMRFSYVRKMQRNEYGQWNFAQQIPLSTAGIPFTAVCEGCPGQFDGTTLNLLRVPDAAAGAQDNKVATFPDVASNYDTIQFAFQRRFSENFFVQSSFDYQWRDELRAASGESRSPLTADPLDAGTDGGNTVWQNHSADVDFRQPSTNWNFRLLGRYVFDHDIAVSANWRMQSGWPWAPIFRTNIPGSGTQPVFLENINNNRSQNVTLVDLRFEKGFAVGGRGRISILADLYNTFNGNPETNFQLRTGSSFNNIIAALDPRTFKIGLRYQF